MDRSDWPPGPWDKEPDSVSWVSAVGLPCELRRSVVSAWCAYVGAPLEHPVWKLDAENELMAHGGIALLALSEELQFDPALPSGLRWAGFDGAHAFDVMPSMARTLRIGTYRDVAYMRTECESLAAQIDAIALLDEAGFDVTTAPEWATEYARRFQVPRVERLAMLRRLAADPVAAQLAESMGIPA